jgi:hypothetical protein
MRGNDLYTLYFTLPTDSPSTHQPHLVLSYPFRTLYCGTKFESSRNLYIGTEGVLHTRCHHEFPFLLWEHIWWKPTSPSKLWKVQSKPHDLDQGRTHERWEGWFAKFMGDGRDDLQRCFCKSLIPPPLSAPLDQHHVTHIEVFIVFTERLVSTSYVAFYFRQRCRAFCDNGSHWWLRPTNPTHTARSPVM